MNDVPTPAPATIRNLRIGIVAATLLTGLLVLYVVNYYPRTDTAVVFANYIGMAPQVDGPITRFYVRDNQLVKAGELLFEIDDRPYGYALERAKSDQRMLEGQIVDLTRTIASQESGVSVSRANTHSAQADLSRFSAAVDEAKADVTNSQQGVERAKAQWAYANNNLHRVEPLLAKQFVTADQVDLARTQEAAQAQALKCPPLPLSYPDVIQHIQFLCAKDRVVPRCSHARLTLSSKDR